MSTTKQILDNIIARRTNINNIQQHLTTITTLTTSSILPTGDQNDGRSPDKSTPSASLLASPSAKAKSGELLDSRSGSGRPRLPLNWNGVKFDLFQNGVSKKGKIQYRLVMSVLNEQRKFVSLRASLNSPLRHMYRQVDMSSAHWQCVLQIQKQLKPIYENLRGSKFYIQGKKGSVDGMCCFMHMENACATVTLIKDAEVYKFDLNADISDAFAKKNGVATVYIGSQNQNKINWISQKELGI